MTRRMPAASSSMEDLPHDLGQDALRDISGNCDHRSCFMDDSSRSLEGCFVLFPSVIWDLGKNGIRPLWHGRCHKTLGFQFLAGPCPDLPLPVVILFFGYAVLFEPLSGCLALRARSTLFDQLFPVCQSYFMSSLIHDSF